MVEKLLKLLRLCTHIPMYMYIYAFAEGEWGRMKDMTYATHHMCSRTCGP